MYKYLLITKCLILKIVTGTDICIFYVGSHVNYNNAILIFKILWS